MPVRISDFIEATNKAESPAVLVDLYADAVASYGYDRFMYSMLTDDVIHGWHNIPSIAHNYPEHWISYYIENEYMDVDPLREVAFQVRQPIVWEDVSKYLDLTDSQETCLQEAVESGLHNGIGVPFHGPFGEVAGVGLASSEKTVDRSQQVVSQLSLLSNQFHTAHLELALWRVARDTIHLTPREKEVLYWCAQGKSNWVISEILNVSAHCVKFHVRNCITKLDSDSKITAVLKAIRLGLITP